MDDLFAIMSGAATSSFIRVRNNSTSSIRHLQCENLLFGGVLGAIYLSGSHVYTPLLPVALTAWLELNTCFGKNFTNCTDACIHLITVFNKAGSVKLIALVHALCTSVGLRGRAGACSMCLGWPAWSYWRMLYVPWLTCMVALVHDHAPCTKVELAALVHAPHTQVELARAPSLYIPGFISWDRS